MISSKWFIPGEDLTDAFDIRRKVFLEEQKVSEAEEFDGSDKNATNLVIYDDEKPVATGRILIKDDKCTLGRIAVLKEERGKHYGDFLVRLLIRKAYEDGYETQYIHAQKQAVKFYEKQGFKIFGDEFLEADIAHYNMSRSGDITGSCK